jgi:KDO2-lipid IV(A) lauroyltransferase
MGKPAFPATSAAEIALKFGAVMIPYFARRKANGLDFDIYIENPIQPSDPVTMMTEATQRLERHVRAAPEQWLWGHRRWKLHLSQDDATIAPGPAA